MVFPRRFIFYFIFVLSLAYYNVMLFVVLLHRFICVGAIQTHMTYLISQRYQIMIVTILKNLNCRYYSHYIIKFVDFISIYFAINLDIVSSCMIFNYLYIGSIDLLQI